MFRPALLSLFALTFSAAAETKSYPAADLTAVDVRGAIAVVVSQGPAAMTVETPGNDFSDLKLETQDGVLKITRNSLKQRRFGRSASVKVVKQDGVQTVKVNGKTVPNYTVRVSMPDVQRLKAAQSSSIRTTPLNAGALALAASTSSKVTATGTSGETSIDASTSGAVDASGLMASGLTLDSSTSGEARARTRSAAPVRVTVSTSAEARIVLIDAAPVTATASTSGELNISGPCTSATLNSSTSGDIEASALLCGAVNADASTSGNIKASARDTLSATASTSGDISVRGAPAERTIKESTSGDVSLAP